MYAASYVLGRIFGQSGDVIVRTPHGVSLQVGLADAYWISFFLKGLGYEPELQRFFEQLQPSPTLFVDCGANNGWWSLAAEKHFRWTPIAIEPAPERVERLRRNRELNGCEFEIVQAAVWSNSSRALNFSTDAIDHAGGHVNQVAGNLQNWRLRDHGVVCTVTVDDIVERFIGSHGGWEGWRILVKLDVEGAESEAMNGCARTLEHPNVFLVYEDHGGDPNCLPTHRVMELGLSAFLLTESGVNEAPVSVEMLRTSKNDVHRGYNLVAVRDMGVLRSATMPPEKLNALQGDEHQKEPDNRLTQVEMQHPDDG
jgi:FkbM family methyltransferase